MSEAATFTSNGHQFRRTTWNGISVIQDVETGYYGASTPCTEYGKLFANWRRNKITKSLLDIASKTLGIGIEGDSTQETESETYTNPPARIRIGGLIVEILDVDNDFRGSYLHPDIFHSFAEWISPEYGFKVSHLMNLINEQNHANQKTLEDTISRLETENEELKSRLVVATTPIDRTASKSAIYASPCGVNEFQLRYQKQEINDKSSRPTRFRHINLFNAEDIRLQTLKILKKQGLTHTNDMRKRVISLDNIDLVFSLIEKISKNEPINIPLADMKRAFLNNELSRLDGLVQTYLVIGKIYERNYELEHEEVIPWEVIPPHIINKYNETNRDNGFDAVVLSEDGNDIGEVIQIKYRANANSYIGDNELKSFIFKCKEKRYKDVHKRLILHNCRLSQALQTMLTELEIEIEYIRDTEAE